MKNQSAGDCETRISRLRKGVFLLCTALCVLPVVGPATALMSGIGFSLFLGNPWPRQSSRFSKILLQVSVVGLGFGLSLGRVLETAKDSILYTAVGIALTLAMGYFIGRVFRTERNTSTLISFGTAICWGSAIAAMAPVIKAKDHETAVALATVFTLNAVALLLFPVIGKTLHLSQTTFGTWAGLAIHDTSSVVGAAASYGRQALDVGTTVKLTRTLWITPVVLGMAWLKGSRKKVQIPLFIVGFIVAASLRTFTPPGASTLWNALALAARQSLVVTLFLIGAGLSREVLKEVGIRPLLQGVTLWFLVGAATILALLLVGFA
jgi:uncharacterized integral membrane protein (TIGR00698 family)